MRNNRLHVMIMVALAGIGGTASAGDLDVSRYYTEQIITGANGVSLTAGIINGPPTPPPGFEAQRPAVDLKGQPKAAAVAISVPAYTWVYGCSAVSGSMIAAYYDRNGYPNMYTGPANGGVMPLTDSTWPTWTDGAGASYPNNPLIASKMGVDGRASKGSIDDYWVAYDSDLSDPYLSGAWSQHTWGTAIGDYMKTSQSAEGNRDGATTFWTYTSSADPLTCADMTSSSITNDGSQGRKAFYEARGYTVTSCYNQKVDSQVSGGFSLTQFRAEIDAGHPVMLNLDGHTIVGIGYEAGTNTIYVNDTWDTSSHAMTWGGSYSGMTLLSVSIVRLAAPPIIAPANDNFANRIRLTGRQVTTSGSNVNASKETGEPNHGGRSGGKSVWWEWVADRSGRVTVSTSGSSFDTILGVYTGSTVAALTTVAGNDDCDSNHDGTGDSLQSCLTFNAVAGRTYSIAVDGYLAASGTIQLGLTARPRSSSGAMMMLLD